MKYEKKHTLFCYCSTINMWDAFVGMWKNLTIMEISSSGLFLALGTCFTMHGIS